ncbi:hypothetical protein B0H12DRAFT_1071122 [Mycena haematopus]|nr:hypothetical protein B0H12DRAFT_1071122 [Mycena haematopus]
MFRLWLGLKALALARIWRLWLLKTPGQAAPSRLGLAWAGFGLSRGFCRNFGIIIDCSNTTTPSSYLRHPKHVTRKVTLMCDLGGSGDGIQEPQGKKMAAEGQIMMVTVPFCSIHFGACDAPVKAGAFRLGFGLEECQAGPKAVSGRYFGSALARYQSQKAGAFWPEAKAGTSLFLFHRARKKPFKLLSPFLSAHPLLTALSIHPSPNTPRLDLPPTALPRLTAFVGVYQHVAELPNPKLLETLDLTGVPVSALDMKAVVTALRALVSLKSLDVRLAAPCLLASIIEVCGGLTTLRIVFAANFGMKDLRSISASLRHLPHLRSFTLYKGHRRFTDGTMLQCALTILADNPGLQEVYLAWFALRERFARRQNGSYVVCRDGTGMRYVDVCERGMRSAKVGGGVFGRRFRYALEGKPYFIRVPRSRLVGSAADHLKMEQRRRASRAVLVYGFCHIISRWVAVEAPPASLALGFFQRFFGLPQFNFEFQPQHELKAKGLSPIRGYNGASVVHGARVDFIVTLDPDFAVTGVGFLTVSDAL